MNRRLLFDFKDAEKMSGWKSIDDVVMGGRSKSTLLWLKEGYLSFGGLVSLENNGGFSSIRSPSNDFLLGKTRGIGITIKGDGKKYKLTVRNDDQFDGVVYQAGFSTSPDAIEEIFFSYDQFIATYHGRFLDNEPALDPALIRRFGFVISEKQAGTFELQVAAIWTSL